MHKCAICMYEGLKCGECTDYSKFASDPANHQGISKLTASYGKTVNRGNFNSERYEFSITVDLLSSDNPEEVAKDIWTMAKNEVESISAVSSFDDSEKNCSQCNDFSNCKRVRA